MAETITDQFLNGGWLDGQDEENGDKCSRIRSGQGASGYVTVVFAWAVAGEVAVMRGRFEA